MPGHPRWRQRTRCFGTQSLWRSDIRFVAIRRLQSPQVLRRAEIGETSAIPPDRSRLSAPTIVEFPKKCGGGGRGSRTPGIGSRQWFSRPPPSTTRPSLRRPIFTYSSRSVRLSVYDAPPHSTAATLRLAQAADLVLLPTGLARDDLEPTVLLAHESIKKNVSKRKIAFALCRTGDSLIEVLEAQRYIAEAGYRVLAGCIPEKVAYRRASDEGRALT